MTVLDRLLRRCVTTESGCLEWTGCLNSRGYGVIGADGTRQLAHRVSYELQVGPIPDGLQIDHVCRNKRCVNPEHLEPVTAQENTRRRPDVNKTHCVHGHEMTDANTIVKQRANGRVERNCRKCFNTQRRLAALRRSAAA